MREMRNICRILIGEHEGKGSAGRPERRPEGNIKMYMKHISVKMWTEFDCLRIGTNGGLL
jgi:hypothetical protein